MFFVAKNVFMIEFNQVSCIIFMICWSNLNMFLPSVKIDLSKNIFLGLYKLYSRD